MGYSTGHEVVDRVGKLNISGNVIPPIWFQTVLSDTGKPNMLACLVLSDITYWYRPSEVRDEVTGKFLGYKKKFRSDLLQRSYEDFATQFNVSKRQIKDAIILLEKLGVIKRVFRTIPGAFGRKFNNVMFISLNAYRLRELTYPDDRKDVNGSRENQIESSDENMSTGCDEIPPTPSNENMSIPYDEISTEGLTENCQTNTKITTETTNHVPKSVLSSVSHAVEMDRNGFIDLFKKQIRYDFLKEQWSSEETDDYLKADILDTCVEIAVSVYFSTGRYRIISGEKRPIEVIKSLLLKLTTPHIFHVVEGFAEVTTPIRNVRAYLLTSMINAISSLGAQNANELSVLEEGIHEAIEKNAYEASY